MPGTAAGKRPGGCLQRVKPLANDYTLKIPIDKEKCEDKSAGRAVHNSIAMSPRMTPTEITTKNKKRNIEKIRRLHVEVVFGIIAGLF